jgi:hypothetical protein
MAGLSTGKTYTLIDDSPTTAGSREETFSIESDSVLASLWIDTTAGDLDVVISTVDKLGKELEVIVFPTQTAPTSNIILRRSGTVLSNMVVRTNYTGAVSYRLTVRAVNSGSGDTSIKISGADSATASSISVTTTPALLIPSSLTDRSGLVLKNYSGSTLFVGFSASEANSSTGYPLAVGEALGMDVAAGVAIWGVTSSGSSDVRLLEAGG